MEENESKVYSKVPAKVSPWTNFKNFIFQPIVVELSSKEQKVFKEVHDFWNQEIYFDKGFHLRAVTPVTVEEPEVKVTL